MALSLVNLSKILNVGKHYSVGSKFDLLPKTTNFLGLPINVPDRKFTNRRSRGLVSRQSQVADVTKPRTKLPWFPKQPVIPDYQSEVTPITEAEEKMVEDLSTEINSQISTDKTGRLFAVVHVMGKQFKVTESDIIIIQGNWPPNVGDEIKLEKVLLAGSTDFTLVGRPLLNKELVSVNATVVEKTLSHKKTHYIMRKRKQTRNINFYKNQLSYVRINSITLQGKINQTNEVEGLSNVY